MGIQKGKNHGREAPEQGAGMVAPMVKHSRKQSEQTGAETSKLSPSDLLPPTRSRLFKPPNDTTRGVNTQMSESRGDILIENTAQRMAHHTQV